MTQTAKMCKELITQGLENLVQKTFKEQKNKYTTSSAERIRKFLNKMCILEPIATLVKGEKMFRLTHVIIKGGPNEGPVYSLDLTKLRKYKTEVFMDTKGYYNILVNDTMMSYKVHTCPPSLIDILIPMWDNVYQDVEVFHKHFKKFRKTMEKELLM